MSTLINPIIIIVNYNQEYELDSFLTTLSHFSQTIEKIFIDDGSTDNSREIALKHGLHVIEHKINQGVGAAIRSGIQFAQKNSYTHVIIMSSNGKMMPQDLNKLIRPICSNEYDYVTGSRFMAGGASPGLSSFRKTMIPLFSSIASFLLGKKFSDITCGFRAYKIDFLNSSPIDISQQWLDRYEMEYYIHYWACHKKLRILEVPVIIPYTHLHASRKSKIQPLTGWWSMIRPFIYLYFGLRK